jgi:hypothetical protein
MFSVYVRVVLGVETSACSVCMCEWCLELRRVYVQCVCASGAEVSVCVSVCALQSGHM